MLQGIGYALVINEFTNLEIISNVIHQIKSNLNILAPTNTKDIQIFVGLIYI